jgi:hypothetical protein
MIISDIHNDLPYVPGDLVEPTGDMLAIIRNVESAISAAFRRCRLYMYIGREHTRSSRHNELHSNSISLIFLPTAPLDNTMYASPTFRGMLHMPWTLRNGMQRARLPIPSATPR